MKANKITLGIENSRLKQELSLFKNQNLEGLKKLSLCKLQKLEGNVELLLRNIRNQANVLAICREFEGDSTTLHRICKSLQLREQMNCELVEFANDFFEPNMQISTTLYDEEDSVMILQEEAKQDVMQRFEFTHNIHSGLTDKNRQVGFESPKLLLESPSQRNIRDTISSSGLSNKETNKLQTVLKGAINSDNPYSYIPYQSSLKSDFLNIHPLSNESALISPSQQNSHFGSFQNYFNQINPQSKQSKQNSIYPLSSQNTNASTISQVLPANTENTLNHQETCISRLSNITPSQEQTNYTQMHDNSLGNKNGCTYYNQSGYGTVQSNINELDNQQGLNSTKNESSYKPFFLSSNSTSGQENNSSTRELNSGGRGKFGEKNQVPENPNTDQQVTGYNKGIISKLGSSNRSVQDPRSLTTQINQFFNMEIIQKGLTIPPPISKQQISFCSSSSSSTVPQNMKMEVKSQHINSTHQTGQIRSNSYGGNRLQNSSVQPSKQQQQQLNDINKEASVLLQDFQEPHSFDQCEKQKYESINSSKSRKEQHKSRESKVVSNPFFQCDQIYSPLPNQTTQCEQAFTEKKISDKLFGKENKSSQDSSLTPISEGTKSKRASHKFNTSLKKTLSQKDILGTKLQLIMNQNNSQNISNMAQFSSNQFNKNNVLPYHPTSVNPQNTFGALNNQNNNHYAELISCSSPNPSQYNPNLKFDSSPIFHIVSSNPQNLKQNQQ